ncbi:metallopeptidase family protein [Lysinibacter sp. HNR]|uniref:metallopeptidase family protein n=1 Tax=Lysinibacter sp. HNR TaxID=3031408 RepID=UPI0024349725|nr:metallopeptidase family protein [Lysinibacter sp. HNR]WGD38105.1 metallopeptidase family protein [Lysinibacter sp. HNR]
MSDSRRETSRVTQRETFSSRHGRDLRSPVLGPELPILNNRIALFDRIAGGTVEYLRSLWPEQLNSVQFDFVSVPTDSIEKDSEKPQLWRVTRASKRITFFRVPLQRSGDLHMEDALQRRMFIEYAVYSAIAEYLGKEPWELLPPNGDRYY